MNDVHSLKGVRSGILGMSIRAAGSNPLCFDIDGFVVSRKMAAKADLAVESRVDRRKRRNRDALIDAAYKVMTEKGIDAATMSEIAELADVGAGTVYNYFESKDELAVCVME